MAWNQQRPLYQQPTGYPLQQPQLQPLQPQLPQMQFQSPIRTAYPAAPSALPSNLGVPGQFPGGGGGLMPQATGFPGQFAGMGGMGLSPQQTGFQGRLMPQATGYPSGPVDPRLLTMANTFMPLNPSAPYSGQGGLNLPAALPQSFAAPPVPQLGPQPTGAPQQQQQQQGAKPTSWALTREEKKQYDSIFRAWDTSNTGFIDGSTALEVFGQSGLSRDELAQIWTLADADNRGKLSLGEFHVAMGLIYRRLNGAPVPQSLPPELVPPSSRDLSSSVDFLKDLLRTDTRGGAPSPTAHTPSPGPTSYAKTRSLLNPEAPPPARKDATVYKHDDAGPDVRGYTSNKRHIDRRAVRFEGEDPGEGRREDLGVMKRELEEAGRALERSASVDKEDEALDRELDDMRWRIRRVKDDLEFAQRRGSSATAEERRRLERELWSLVHEKVPEVERKVEERERRRRREGDRWKEERDRRNDSFGRAGFREDERGYERGTFDKDDAGERYDRDREYGRDRDRDYDRDRERERDRDRDYDRRDRDRSYDERDRTRLDSRSPAPPPPPSSAATAPPPAPPPAPTSAPASTAPNTKHMTPEERAAFLKAEAQRRIMERQRALGLAPSPAPSPAPPSGGAPGGAAAVVDEDVGRRLEQEKREKEERSRLAEQEAEERERTRRERLDRERAASSPAPPPAPVAEPAMPATPGRTPAAPPKPKGRAAPPPPPLRKPVVAAPTPQAAPAPPPPPPAPVARPAASPAPPAPKAPVVSVSAPTPPAAAALDPEELALQEREASLRAARQARLDRLAQLEREEQEEREAEERMRKEREAARTPRPVDTTPKPAEASPAPAPAPPPPPPAPPAPAPAAPAAPTGMNGSATPQRHNPFRKDGPAPTAAAPTTSGTGTPGAGNNPFFKPGGAAAAAAPAPPKTAASPGPVRPAISQTPSDSDWDSIKEKSDDDDSSDDEYTASRNTRAVLAKQLFGGIMPARPTSGQSIGRGSTPTTPVVGGAPPAPAPPAPPAPAPPSAGGIAAPIPAPAAGPVDMGAVLSGIQQGTRLRKTVTNDRSGPASGGRVIGEIDAPEHIAHPPPEALEPPRQAYSASPEPEHAEHEQAEPMPRSANRQSVDWYAGLAADHANSSVAPSVPSLAEEDEEEQEAEPVRSSVPQIQIEEHEEAHVQEAVSGGPMADVDMDKDVRVRTLYPYHGQRSEDLQFEENVVITAHPSKSGGDWWYGSIVKSGDEGFFPRSYVEEMNNIMAAKALYPYQGSSPEELPFAEGDHITVVDRSDENWWKAEQGGVIFNVPAAYLELQVLGANTDSVKTVTQGPPQPQPMEATEAKEAEDETEPTAKLPEDHELARVADDVDPGFVDPSSVPSSSTSAMPVGLGLSPPVLSSSTLSPAPPSPVPSSEPVADDEADSSSDEYLSFESDEDEDGHEAGLEEDRRAREAKRLAEQTAREVERQRVMQAAGLVVKTDTQRKPPPPPIRRMSRRHRPPPLGEVSELQKLRTVPEVNRDKPLPTPIIPPPSPSPQTPQIRYVDDAFQRYEDYKQRQSHNRQSIASTISLETMPTPSSPGPTPLSPVLTIGSVGSVDSRFSQHAPSRSDDLRSSWASFISKIKPSSGGVGELKPPLVISGPISAPISGQVSRENSPAFGTTWSTLVSKEALEGMPDRERKRQEAIFELINTEDTYVRDLQLIVEIFYRSVIEYLDDKSGKLIFDNIEDILLCNSTFLSSLEERQKQCRLYIDMIGDILEDYMANMAIYESYCVNQAPASRVLQRLRESNKPLGAHLEQLRSDPQVRGLDLSSYLLEPMQRITRYPLLLRQILHYTEGPDAPAIQRALDIATSILNTINESVREREGEERLAAVSKDLWIGNGQLILNSDTRYMGRRRLLKEGTLCKAKSGRKLQVFLCSDILVMTTDSPMTLYRMPIPLTELAIKDLPNRDDSHFQLVLAYPRGGESVALRAASPRECHSWMRAIGDAIQACSRAEKRASRRR
ncbi:hypothetical protein CALCODRAFT_456827 [Calocera cornea HHB12733]|uniref:Actin cytoskeleton-regulatory complex protein PAN1 n=1 Tax=Calocera cornea HHB12733 TaxID=1353952 RepID=A0A165E8V1_9BASI|nr:hypothetical protein CALCODRAFT_456827 [Calocera cornea HHB12733]